MEFINNLIKKSNILSGWKNKRVILLLISLIVFGVMITACTNNKKQEEDAYIPAMDDIPQEKVAQEEEETTEIDVVDMDNEKMVAITLETSGRANPFLPGSEAISDTMRYGFDLMAPPESLTDENSESAKIVTTKISGIMYDVNKPSAILNIEGSDYLVRAGDYINNYKILSIGKDIVTVQLGKNIYKTKVGEVIADGEMNHNTIDHLENKFGGAKK